MTSVLSGALFGSALLYSGVSRPTTIISQLSMQDFHMVQTFLTASAFSALIAYASHLRSSGSLPPRSPSPLLRRLTPYDANILGGLLQGIGMALSGACPGTGLVQMATGLRSGQAFVAGGMLGAKVYRHLLPWLQPAPAPAPGSSSPSSSSSSSSSSVKQTQSASSSTTPTLPSALHLSPGATAVLWTLFCAGLVAATSALSLPSGVSLERAVRGGLAIGAAQAASVLLRGSMVGVSGGYAQVESGLSALLVGRKPPRDTDAARFALGVLLGGATLASFLAAGAEPWSWWPVTSGSGRAKEVVAWQWAFVGGVFQVLGARMAGGCTSGHGISGMATFGLASFVTVGANFAGGIFLRALIGDL